MPNNETTTTAVEETTANVTTTGEAVEELTTETKKDSDAPATMEQTLSIMWKGMVSIFAVIIILTVLVQAITKFVKDPVKDNE